jgi:netrin-G3 ligand
MSCKAGLHPAVKTKNRYEDVVPFDRSRVILKTLDASENYYVNTADSANYINASFVDGYRRRDAFIVTQSPLVNTVNDFWKMIWEQNCYCIVMLTPLEEEGKVRQVTALCIHYERNQFLEGRRCAISTGRLRTTQYSTGQ